MARMDCDDVISLRQPHLDGHPGTAVVAADGRQEAFVGSAQPDLCPAEADARELVVGVGRRRELEQPAELLSHQPGYLVRIVAGEEDGKHAGRLPGHRCGCQYTGSPWAGAVPRTRRLPPGQVTSVTGQPPARDCSRYT
jgi:hypothetical protein